MDLSQIANLPSTVVELIGFVIITNLTATGYLIKVFLSKQKEQTDKYMDYIQTKNGHLEKARVDFGKMLDDQRKQYGDMIEAAARRLESCEKNRR